MKTNKCFFAGLIMSLLPLSSVNINAKVVDIPLQVEYNDPTYDQGGPQRNPVEIPEVGIEDYTLYFNSLCYGCTLRLVDENDNVVYTTIVIGDTLVLPSTLSGEYELQIIFDDCYFHGVVEF